MFCLHISVMLKPVSSCTAQLTCSDVLGAGIERLWVCARSLKEQLQLCMEAAGRAVPVAHPTAVKPATLTAEAASIQQGGTAGACTSYQGKLLRMPHVKCAGVFIAAASG